MNELIVADTSCLIVLSKTGYMDLLQSLFVKVWITPEVANEFGEPLPAWIEIHAPKDYNIQLYLTTQLDTGEASAISLALQTPSKQVLIDERKGRKIAAEMGLSVIGTIKILILAKENGLLPSLKVAISQFEQAGFRLSARLVVQVLDQYEPE